MCKKKIDVIGKLGFSEFYTNAIVQRAKCIALLGGGERVVRL